MPRRSVNLVRDINVYLCVRKELKIMQPIAESKEETEKAINRTHTHSHFFLTSGSGLELSW